MPRIIITPGEPAGIGPDIVIQVAQESFDAELIVIADPALLLDRAKQCNLPLKLIPFDKHASIEKHQPGCLKIISVELNHSVLPGQLTTENAKYVIQSLEIASRFCEQHVADALTTGPVHKGIINDAGIHFTGHTEFFANRCHVKEPIMLFVTPQTKVALLTTHLPLSEVPRAITQEKIKNILRLLSLELSEKFGLNCPRILVCGLNPHAGEHGHLGREANETIIPAILELQKEQFNITGPFPADTIFTDHRLRECDAVLAMYHDQALPVVKYMSFGHAVNVTLGLPYIRTSVDHGVALDVAGTSRADPGSMIAAIKLAIDLC